MSSEGATAFFEPKESSPDEAADGAGTDAVAEDDDSVLTAWPSCHSACLDRVMLTKLRET